MLKKVEFSKIILITVYITALLFTGVAAYLTFIGMDSGSFAPIVLAVWAELGTSSGFYYWKAKSENKIKLLTTVPAELIKDVKELLERE